MKECTWCGKEYPDEADWCAIDESPLRAITQAVGSGRSLLEVCPHCGRKVLFTTSEICPSCSKPRKPTSSVGRDSAAAKQQTVNPSPPASRQSAPRSGADIPSSGQYQYSPVSGSVDPAQDFRPLLDLATPELYERNAFRLLEVHVEATERELAKRKQVMEVASRNKLPVPAGPCRILPRTLAPDDHEIRDCSHAIQDAERRLAQEFFWFWPLALGQAGNDVGLRQLHQGDSDGAANIWRERERSPEEGPSSKHNLAVLYHFSALEIEREFLNGKPATKETTTNSDTEKAKTAEAERYWSESYRYWKMVTVEQSCWSRVVARIRAMDDKSLTTGAARRMERRLPVALTLINARLAIRAHQNGKTHHGQRHVARIRGSGFGAEAVDEALRIAVEPTRSAIKTICDLAKKDTDTDPAKADAATERLLEQTAGSLALLDLLLLEDNPARIAEHDQIALAGLSCIVSFGNKTENYKRTLELLDRLTPLAASTAASERVAHNRKIVQGIYEGSLCWFCGQNQGNDKCPVEVKMHGEIEHIPIDNGTRTRWSHITIKVPRCQACRDEAAGEDLTGVGCLGVLVGGGAFWLLAANDLGVLGAILGLAIAIVPALIVNSKAKKTRRPGIAKKSQNDFPRIKQLQSEGWGFGEKPPGVE